MILMVGYIFSLMNSSCCLCSSSVRLYDLNTQGSNPGFISIAWSHSLDLGKHSTFSLKMSKYSWYSAGTFSSAVDVSCVLYLKTKASDGFNVALIDNSMCSSVRLASVPIYHMVISLKSSRSLEKGPLTDVLSDESIHSSVLLSSSMVAF